MNKNIYTNVYKKEMNNKNFDFSEPAENFIRMYKIFIKKKILNVWITVSEMVDILSF